MSGALTDSTSATAGTLGVTPPAVAMASSAPTPKGNFFQATDQLQQQKEAAQKPIYDRMQQDYAKDRLRFDKAADSYQPMADTPPAPKPPENDPLKGFGSAASIFAMIASSFSHTPAIAAMNGMASAINATKQNDWQAYDVAYKQWKDNTQLAIEHHKLQAEDMKNAMEMMQTNISAGTAMAKAVAAQSDDRIAMKLLQQGEYDKLASLQMERQRTGAAMQEAALRVQELHMQIQEKRDQVELQKAIVAAPDDATRSKLMNEALLKAEVKNPELLLKQQTEAQGTAGLVASSLKDWQAQFTAKNGRPPTSEETLKQRGVLEQEGKPATKVSNQEERARVLATDKFKNQYQRDPTEQDAPIFAQMVSDEMKNQTTTSSRNSIMVRRSLTDARDASSDLSNIAQLPITIDRGVFGGAEQGPGLLAATKADLANAVTGSDVKAYNDAMAGIGHAIGGLETGGQAVTDYVTKSFDALKIVPGDTQLDKMRKLATMRQNVDNALDSLLTDPSVSEAQKADAKTILSSLKTAIPYTVPDVTAVQFSKDPNMTVMQAARQAGLAGGDPLTAPKPASATSPTDAPVPGAQKASDGKWYVIDPKRPGKFLRVDP
jgi:hypothetical protein